MSNVSPNWFHIMSLAKDLSYYLLVTCAVLLLDSAESFRGFYKGLCVSMMQNIPNICIVFLMYEYVRHYFDPTQSFFAVEPRKSSEAPTLSALAKAPIISLKVPPKDCDDTEIVSSSPDLWRHGSWPNITFDRCSSWLALGVLYLWYSLQFTVMLLFYYNTVEVKANSISLHLISWKQLHCWWVYNRKYFDLTFRGMWIELNRYFQKLWSWTRPN